MISLPTHNRLTPEREAEIRKSVSPTRISLFDQDGRAMRGIQRVLYILELLSEIDALRAELGARDQVTHPIGAED